jgi:hypothetical protein
MGRLEASNEARVGKEALRRRELGSIIMACVALSLPGLHSPAKLYAPGVGLSRDDRRDDRLLLVQHGFVR